MAACAQFAGAGEEAGGQGEGDGESGDAETYHCVGVEVFLEHEVGEQSDCGC